MSRVASKPFGLVRTRAQIVLGALPRTPSPHERRQPGVLSWADSGVLWAPMPNLMGEAWPQGTPTAGGLWPGGGAALCASHRPISALGCPLPGAGSPV